MSGLPWLRRLTDRLENKNRELVRKHGLQESPKLVETRERLHRKRELYDRESPPPPPAPLIDKPPATEERGI